MPAHYASTAILLLVAVSSSPAPEVPEPIAWPRGSVVLAGGPTSAAALEHFAERAGNSAARLFVVDPAGALAEEVDGLEAARRLAAEVLERGGVLGGASAIARAAGARRLVGPAPGLGWIPGAIVSTEYEESRDRPRVVAALEESPDLIALAIERDGTLVLRERWLEAYPARTAHSLVAGWASTKALRSSSRRASVP
ncbi:MAG: hypothetical protein GY711_30700 [bacterium]|nr:hypothetical protein [bacterium]